MLGAFYAYEKDLLREYHYRLLKCFESAQRTTDAELCVFLSKKENGLSREILDQKFICYP